MTESGFDPLGAHFISYRQSDGTGVANELTWRLRSAGVPVWRDASDLLPGSTTARLREALDSGLAGGVLVITPEVGDSHVVKTIEAPRLADLAANTRFGLAIANAVRSETGLDYRAPDRLLAMPEGTLTDVLQYDPGDPAQIRRLVDGVRMVRVANLVDTVATSGGVFTIDVQTRNVGQVHDRTDAELDIRVKPPSSGRRPDEDGLGYFADGANGLPAAVTRTGAQTLVLRGGAHLSIAIALGCLFPSTRIGRMTVEDHQGNRWEGLGDSADPAPGDWLRSVEIGGTGSGRVAIYVDLSDERNDAAFDAFVAEHDARFAAFKHVTAATPGRLDPRHANALAAALAATVRQASYANMSAEAHLLYRGPFGLAPLVGRRLNTIRSVLYEWEDLNGPPRYVATLACTPSNLDAPIRAVQTPV